MTPDSIERYEVQTSDIELPHSDGGSRGLRAVLARPISGGPWPAVVMVHEAFGITEVMRRQASRMASAGFAVVMPDLFTEGSARTCLRETFRALMTGRGRAFVDIESARGWIADRADTTGSVGVIGFCMGGGFALMTAARGFDVASINYGRLPDDLGPVLDGACPIVASYGGSDRSIRGAADRLEHELADRAIVHDVREYPAAGHSFMNDPDSFPRLITPVLTKVLGIGPDPDAAADSWRRIVRFFGEHLASSSRQPD